MTMFFDAQAALRKLNTEPEPLATSATTATQSPANQLHVADVADVATPGGQYLRKPEPPELTSPYGNTWGGRMKTWTGKIVSLDEWRSMLDWERHGSTGKVWNGLTRRWERKE